MAPIKTAAALRLARQFCVRNRRTPQDVATFVNDEITWAETNPGFRVELVPAPPMILIEAWNEFGEGSHVLPTAGEGTAYGDAFAAMLKAP